MINHNVSLKLVLSNSKLNHHIKFKYAQCESLDCSAKGPSTEIQPEFKPNCKEVNATEKYCLMLVTVVNTKYEPKKVDDTMGNASSISTPGHHIAPVESTAEVIGVLPYIPMTYE